MSGWKGWPAATDSVVFPSIDALQCRQFVRSANWISLQRISSPNTSRCRMSSKLLASRSAAGWAVISVTGILALLVQAKEPSLPTAAKAVVVKPATAEPAPEWGESFAREWLPNYFLAHGGDGLGPVFNDSSCLCLPQSRRRWRRRPGEQECRYRHGLFAFNGKRPSLHRPCEPCRKHCRKVYSTWRLSRFLAARAAPRRAAKGKRPARRMCRQPKKGNWPGSGKESS